MTIARGCLIAVAVLLGFPLLVLAVMQLNANRKAEAEAWAQLTDHYKTTRISKNDRVYFGSDTYYYAYAQICYDIAISLPTGRKVRKFAMVSGDDDGGSFTFRGEFSSMSACEAKFDRG